MRTLDYFVIAIYLIGVFAVGIASRGRKRTVDDYFQAHGTFKGKLGTLLIGLSIAASFFSGISFIVLSSFAFSNGVQLFMGIMTMPFCWLVLRFWFLERYWAAGNRHPYDVVEARFGYGVRACLSVVFVLFRIGWMSVIVYAPTVILMGALGLAQAWFWPIVLAIGGTCTALAVIGGIRGLIVTDAIQFLIIALGLIFIIVSVLVRMHWAMGGIVADLRATDHLRLFDFTLSFTAPWTFWAVFIGSFVSSTSMYTADQMALQRYLASESRSSVSRSFLINVFGAIGVVVLLVSVGLLLSVWYLHHPDPALPGNPDKVLPYFAARELPPGMSGLLIAAILAATINALTSGINSLAGAIINDFVARIGQPREPAALYRLARVMGVVLGLLATLSAGFASHLGSVLNSSNILMGAFQGVMFVPMLWAISRAAVRPGAVVLGMLLGGAAGCWVATTAANSYWISPAGCVVAIAVPWLDRILRGPRVAAAKAPAG